MDCTVDSMLTTTPFLRPREGCEPRPTTSMDPSTPTSPTSATTLDVPISRPTINARSLRLATCHLIPLLTATGFPADGKTRRVAQVDIGNLVRAACHDACRGRHEPVEALVHLQAPETQPHTVVEHEFPGAALIQ